MDSLALLIADAEPEDAKGLEDQLLLFINGRNIVSLVKEVELPFVQVENEPELAGSYLGLNTKDLVDYGNPFLGIQWPDFGEKAPILRCICGSIGCWPLLVKITVTDDQVV